MAEDFACDKFVAQKRRADVCRNCYQPLKVHSKKQATPVAPGKEAAVAKSTPKVFERYQKNRESLKGAKSGAPTQQSATGVVQAVCGSADVSPDAGEKVDPLTGTASPVTSNGAMKASPKSGNIPAKPPPPTVASKSPPVPLASKSPKPSVVKPSPPPVVKPFSPPPIAKPSPPPVAKPLSPPPVAKPSPPPIAKPSPPTVAKPLSPPPVAKPSPPPVAKPSPPPVAKPFSPPLVIKPFSPPPVAKPFSPHPVAKPSPPPPVANESSKEASKRRPPPPPLRSSSIPCNLVATPLPSTSDSASNDASSAQQGGQTAVTTGQVVDAAGQAAETAGQAAETAGQAAETAGQEAETARQAAETAGQEAETTGQASETAGQAAETTGQAIGQNGVGSQKEGVEAILTDIPEADMPEVRTGTPEIRITEEQVGFSSEEAGPLLEEDVKSKHPWAPEVTSPPAPEVTPPPAPEVTPPPAPEVTPPPAPEVTPPPAPEVTSPPAPEVTPPPAPEVTPPPAPEVTPPPAPEVTPPPAPEVTPPPAPEVTPPPAPEVTPPPAPEVTPPPAPEVTPPPAPEVTPPPAPEVTPPPAPEVTPPPAPEVTPPPAPEVTSPLPPEVFSTLPPEVTPPPDFSGEAVPPILRGEDSSASGVPPPLPVCDDGPPMSYVEHTPPPPPISFAENTPPPPPLPFAEDIPPPHIAADMAPPIEDVVPVDVPPPGAAPPPPPPIPPGGIPIAPPPPPPVPIARPNGQQPAAAAPLRVPPVDSAMAQAMASIRSGGVALRAVPPPVERRVGEEKVVDVASELRRKMMERRKKENEGVSAALEESKEEARKIKDLLETCSGTHSFMHQLKALLARVDRFLQTSGLSQEMLCQKLQWPIHLERSLRDVVGHMTLMEQRVQAAEHLCQQTLANCQGTVSVANGSSGGSGGVVGSAGAVRINSEAVEKCVGNVVKLAKAVITDDSRYFLAAQDYPVDESDLQSFIIRAGTAVQPLVDLLYQKAFTTYDSIFEISVSNFDRKFRVQNAQRLLKLCCSLSQAIALHLNLPRHPNYSQAQLRQAELKENFVASTKVATREGEWDTEEVVQLGHTPKLTEPAPKDPLVQQLLASLSTGGEGVMEELELTPEKFAKIEMELLKAILSRSSTELADAAIALTRKVYNEDEITTHHHDFDWLLDSVVKGNHERINHLVTSCALNVNSRSREAGNSLLHRAAKRQDLGTVACLIRLGADPLMKNDYNDSPLRHLAIKCFPPAPSIQHSAQTAAEHVFNLAAYVNNPSLSDVTLVADDGKKFFAHRLVLCVQSQVFKVMLDSDLWAESRNKEMPLPTVSGHVLQHLLQYLYTGSCMYPRDDLNLGVELMGLADQFMLDPMKLQCEAHLSDKIDVEVVIPLYHAAVRYNAARLLANSSHFLLTHYSELEDHNHEVLLQILEQSVSTTNL